MDIGNTTVKLKGTKSYSSTNNASNVFKEKFYVDSKLETMNDYEYIDYNIDISVEEEKERLGDKKNIFTTIKDYCVTWGTSVSCGALELVENLGDGLIMLGAARVSAYTSIVDTIFGTNYTEKVKSTAAKVVAYDWTDKLYEEAIDFFDVDDEIAHGWVHTAGNFVGTTTAYVAMSCIPGGAAVTAATGACAAMGQASEQAFNCGANFDQALAVGTIAGVAGAASGGALNKIGGLAGGATSLTGVAGYTLLGAGVSVTEPLINTTAQYYIYANEMVDENGNPIYDNWGDYYVESGGLLNTAIAGVVGGSSTAIKGVKSYNQIKDLEKKGFSIDAEKQYKKDLKNNGYKFTKNTEIVLERRNAYNDWYDECQTNGGWQAKNLDKRFKSIGDASIELDSDGTINAKKFWQLKGNKELRVENPQYSAERMKNLNDIKKGGTVEVYLTEDQYVDYKYTPYHEGCTIYDGRLDSDGATRVYCTKLSSKQSQVTSSSKLGEILGTGWEEGKKYTKVHFLPLMYLIHLD